MSSNREVTTLETIGNIVNNQCKSMRVNHRFDIIPLCQYSNSLNDMIFVHVYNYCIEIGLLNEMEDKDVIILFMKLLSKVLNQHDIITLDSILNGESFHGSCVRFLSNFQNKLCHTSITDNEQLLGVIQSLLKTNANLCLLSMPPPIIPGLMNIDKDNQKCGIHYFPIISELIIKLENKENMSDDECISKSDQFVYIVEIICGYHHYNLSFWSIYPSQSSDPDNEESSFDIIDIESNKDDDSTDFEAVSLDHSEDSDSELNQQYVNIFCCDDTRTKYEKQAHSLQHNSCLSILNESPEIVRVSVPNKEDSQLELVIDDEFNYFDQNISRSRNPSFSTSASTPITHRASPSYSCVLKNSSSGDSLFALSTSPMNGDNSNKNMHPMSPSPSYVPKSPSPNSYGIENMYSKVNNPSDELIVNLGRTRFNSSGSNNNGGKRDRNKDNNNHTQNELDNDDEDEKKHEGIKLNADAPEFTPANQGKKDNISEPNKLVSIDENEPMPILCINSSNSSDETELVPSSNHNRYNNGKYDVKDEPKKRPEVLTNPQINDDCKCEEKETSPDNDSIAILNVAAPAFTPTNNLPRTLSINGTFLSNQGQYLSGYQHLNENEQKQNNFQCRPYRSNRTQRKNKKGKNGKGKPSRSRYITELNDNNIYSYEPRRDIRIESFIWVPTKFTKETLPSSIRETFSNLYKYLDKSTAMQYHFQCQLQFDGEKIRIFNYDLHHKSTNEVLYFVAQSQKRRNGYEWKLVNKLFTKEDIMNTYRIRSFELPQSSRINSEFGNMMNIQKQIMAQHASICTKLTEKEWQRIPIHNNEYSTQKRMTYSMTPQMFKQAINDCIDSQNGQAELIPIVMFYGDKFKLCFIHIIQLDDHINIGISYIYNQQKQCIEINGIHLKKDRIQQQHELAVPGCAGNCRCLNGFVSCIDVLHIGNPDDAQNKINGKQHTIDAKNEEINKLKSELAKCKCKIQPQSNHPNSNISDSV